MKAISLWEPWASWMACGYKRIETRSWPIRYHGDLLICSAKRKITNNDEIHVAMVQSEIGDEVNLWIEPTYGCALCVVELFDCSSTNFLNLLRSNDRWRIEQHLGDYRPGRFAWHTRNLRKFSEPIPVIGHQGIWNLSVEAENHIKSRLLNA